MVQNGLSRRGFLQATGAAATAAGLSQLVPSSGASQAATIAARPFQPRGRLRQRPNFLYIMADEYRFPVPYESPALAAFRAQYLTAEQFFRQNALEFSNHYIMSAACVPSRASIFTGQYPSLHGVSQTTGAAKSSFEQDMFWLDPATVPTMGSYFRAGGYDTYYKGKWHFSEADILIPGTHSGLASYNSDGSPNQAVEDQYVAAERLDQFGFSGWIGPEPHGSDPLNSASSASAGIGRDVKFADQTVDLLQALAEQGRGANPWLVVSSFLNPHDIALWGELTLQNQNFNLMGQLEGTEVPQALFDPTLYGETSNEDLSYPKKPHCQMSYVEVYPQMLQPIVNTVQYRQFYYQMQQNVNGEIQKVLNALAANRQMADNTIVIFTSDHGDMLGAHGGMHQKWYQAYEETIHVPFFVYNPILTPGPQSVEALTSHADLIPTMLGLAGIDPNEASSVLAQNHTEVHPFVGRDLSSVILAEEGPGQITGAVYFMTDDDVSRGAQQTTNAGVPYMSVIQPNHIETVVTFLPTGAHGAPEKWKYSRYSDNPQFWSDPEDSGLTDSRLPPDFDDLGESRDVVTFVNGNVNLPGTNVATTTVKTAPVPDDIEAYNVTQDPLEMDNLVNSTDPTIQATIAQLESLLHSQCEAKRLTPSSGMVPGQPAC